MRTIEYGTTTTTHVPAFLTKLWKLVTDVSCNELICWSLAGSSFIIYDEIRFSKELLPLYFKHNNMASFVRQLNMYGFRKLSCIDQGGMHCYKSEIEFYHQYFIKGQEKLLELIKRKIPHSKSDEPKVKQEYIDELISNIKSLKGKQDCAEQGMRHLRRENRVLWRQVNLLTERYSKQQAVIQQLLPYFLGMIRSRQELTMKRKSTMALPETETHNKVARLSPPYYVQEDSNSCMPSSPGNVSNRGPVIHDVTEMENSKMYPGTVFCSPNTTPTPTKECEAIVDSPLSCSLESSEQAIDSPYTDPGSMETLNILNQNFERRNRSNSLSPNMGMRRTPLNAAASIRLPSPGSMPGASNSMPCFTTTSSSRMPTFVNDEASTSSSRMPFVNGEASASSSRMPTFVNGEASASSSRMPTFVNGEASASSSRMPTFVNGEASASSSRMPTFVNDEGSRVVIDEATSDVPLMRIPFVPKMEDTCTDSGMYSMSSLISDRVSSIINDEAVSSLLEERGSSMMAGGTAPLINEMAPENSGNKFPSTSFMTNIKSDMSEINWMMNQSAPAPSYAASEPSLENWLGQIFKSDNLTPGCSLPQPQQQGQVGNVNFV